jgi:hypothetical protein
VGARSSEAEDWNDRPEEQEEEEEEAMADREGFLAVEKDEDANCSVGFK